MFIPVIFNDLIDTICAHSKDEIGSSVDFHGKVENGLMSTLIDGS